MMKRLLKLLTAAVAVIVLFTACEQFLKDPEDFLSYWASEAFIKDHSIDSAHRPDGAGVPCVGSSVPVDIMLTVHNPKGFSFVMSTSSVSAGIVEFKELSSHPEAGTDYELQQTGSGTLKLTYNPSLLQKYEQGSGSLNPTITLKAKDGRVFKQTYTFGIKSNTPPPKPKEIVIAKTTETTPHYVLCLKFDPDEMKKKVAIDSDSATPSMVPVHKDIKNITIKEDSSSDGSSYNLSYNDDDSDFQNPEGILQTGSFIKRESVAKLTEDIPQAQEKWVLYYKTNIEIEAGNDLTTYYITLHDREGVVSDEAVARIEASGPTHTVTFSVVGGEGGTLEANYDGTNSSTKTSDTVQVTNEASVTFTAFPDTGWEVDSWTVSTGSFTLGGGTGETSATLSTVTAPTTVTVRFKKITYKVHFNKNDSNASGNMGDQSFTYGQSQNLTANGFTKTGYTFAGWATSADGTVQYTNQQSVSNLTTTANGTVDLYAKWTANTYKVHFNKNDSNASGNMVDQSFTYGQSQNLTANGFTKTGYTFDGWATNADGNVQYSNQQSVSNLTTTANGTVNLYAKWTANTYTVTFRVADGKGGTLKANYGSNPSTMTSATVQVTNGDSVSFTATPDEGWEFDRWTGVSSSSTTATLYNVTAPTTVTVKFKGGELNLAGGSGAWERLKKEAAKPDGAHTIIIDGEIKAEYGDDGEITLGRDLIIQGKDSSAVLHADQRSRIFHVQDNKTLTLKDITLKNGREVRSNGRGGGVLVESGSTLIMKNSSITGCEAKRGGGVYAAGTFTMEGTSSITSCNTEHEGSGVYADGTFTMKGSTSIQACSTMGVYVSGTFDMQGSSSIQNCDDGVYVYGTFNMQDSSFIKNCDNGVYVVSGTFNMKDGAEVVTNDEKNDVYLASGRSINVTGTLTKKPAARITPDSYTDGRVLATGAFAEKANFTVTPKNGREHWRYKKKDGVIKFVPATLTVTFVKLKCVKEKDYGDTAEYYWTMKVNGVMVDDQFNENSTCELATGQIHTINKSFTESFSYFPADKKIPVDIEIYEEDNGSDNHIGTTKASLWYHYNADAWQWGYRGSGHENGNQGVNTYKQINEGSAYEVEFTEQYRHREGDTDVTIRISWKE